VPREEAFAQAWSIIADVNPFPAVLGRVCPHPCEAHCNRGELDQPLAINAMERFLGDWGIRHGLGLQRLTDQMHPEWLGVIGSGPSGLSFAYQMARRGYRVTVYERQSEAGGMLRYGIPDFRLPQETLDAEIERILGLGVELRLGCEVGREITFGELKERHSALYLGIGAQRGRGLGIPGEDGPGVWPGTEYLERVNCGEAPDLGGHVAVIGGGNTAIDAARVARRSGAAVSILYRRSPAEMPAFAPEVEEALEEEVDIQFLTAPVRLERNGQELTALVAQRMRLGEPDDSGRRSPVPVPDSEFEVPVDTVLVAVSQEPVWDGIDGLDLDRGWILTNQDGAVAEGVWAGGDARGLGIAGEAIVHGRRAAEAIHRSLRGHPEPEPDSRATVVGDQIVFEYYEELPAVSPHHLAPAERLAGPTAEVAQGITEEQVLAEAERCFSCGDCFGCQQCWMFCNAGCFTKVEAAEPGVYFTLSLDTCESCGKCVEVCPCGYLQVD
jgi:NADPH-dependent glutamate synthase beta subunit-like oxidoreductase